MRVLNVERYDKWRDINVIGCLPSNSLPFVLIRKEVVDYIYRHASYERQHEVGGYLLGFPIRDVNSGKLGTYIEQAIKGEYRSSPTRVHLLPKSAINIEHERNSKNTVLVGWYHSHPYLGVFYSGTDVNNHRTNHPEPYQVGIVVDTTAKTSQDEYVDDSWFGIFVWSNNKDIVRLPHDNIFFVDKSPVESEKVNVIQPGKSDPYSAYIKAIARQWDRKSRDWSTEFPIVVCSMDIVNNAKNFVSRGQMCLLVGERIYIGAFCFYCIFGIIPAPNSSLVTSYIKRLAKLEYNKSFDSNVIYMRGKNVEILGFSGYDVICMGMMHKKVRSIYDLLAIVKLRLIDKARNMERELIFWDMSNNTGNEPVFYIIRGDHTYRIPETNLVVICQGGEDG